MIDFGFTAEDEELRMNFRDWIENNLPHEWRKEKPGDAWGDRELFEISLAWDKKLYEGGWKGLTWPKQYGGRGGKFSHEVIFYEETSRVYAPEGVSKQALHIVGPMIMLHGSEEQKSYYLPRILSAEDVWCQGFSEPNAGSDLAGISTAAADNGQGFVINGQKRGHIKAHNASFCYLMTRTSREEKRYNGLTMFILDMKSEGVSLTPIKQPSGESNFNILTLDNVFIPYERAIGEVGNGWKVAMDALAFERALPIIRHYPRFEHELIEMEKKGIYVEDLREEVWAMRNLAYKYAIEVQQEGTVKPQHGSASKLIWGPLHQKITERALERLSFEESLKTDYFNFLQLALTVRKDTVAGGTAQIQKNIIAKKELEL